MRNHEDIGRRHFLRGIAAAGAAAAFPAIVPSSALGNAARAAPSGRVGVALISCGERAGYAARYHGHAKAEIVAVCDPVQERREKAARQYGCPAIRDFRDALARKDVDAVHISTPDHWHVPIALMAAAAGKDMYIEKPLGLCIEQCLAARVIVDRHRRIVQYGAQQRSLQHVRMGLELALNGHIGRIRELFAWAPQGESGGSAEPVLPVPPGFDYDLWLGPAPQAPFCADRCLGRGPRKGIYHIHDYSIGFIAGWGAHPMDMLQWWADHAGRREIPVRYEGSGALPLHGLFNTVTHWDVRAVYADGLPLRFMDGGTAARLRPHPGVEGDHGTLLVGEEGWIRVSRNGWMTSPRSLMQRGRDPGERRLEVSPDQIDNFVDGVLPRRTPVDDLHSAIRSDLACHLSEIAVRTGRPIRWDPIREVIADDADAARLMRRAMREPWGLPSL